MAHALLTSPLIARASLASLACGCALWLTACPFGPALPIDEDPPNVPPLIDQEFLQPNTDEVTVQRDGEPRTFAVSQFLDQNPDDKLEVRWFSAQALGDGVLAEDLLGPDPTNTSLYLDLFTRYNGTQYSLDPCDGQWPTGSDRFTLTIVVADGDIVIDSTTKSPRVSEGIFTDRYTWVLNFTGECPASQ